MRISVGIYIILYSIIHDGEIIFFLTEQMGILNKESQIAMTIYFEQIRAQN